MKALRYGVCVRYFNTTGPCVPELHYMLPAEARLPEARPLVYFLTITDDRKATVSTEHEGLEK